MTADSTRPEQPQVNAPTEGVHDHAQHTFSAAGAAAACGVSRATISRRLSAGEIAGAEKDDMGAWVIPVSGLLAAGLHPGRPAPPDEDEDQDDDAEIPAVTIARLEGELAVERVKREAAEQYAELAERLAQERADRIGELQRQLEAPPTTPTEPAPTAPEQPATPEPAPTPTPAPQTPEQRPRRLRRIWQIFTE